jgi:hypothetical protein
MAESKTIDAENVSGRTEGTEKEVGKRNKKSEKAKKVNSRIERETREPRSEEEKQGTRKKESIEGRREKGTHGSGKESRGRKIDQIECAARPCSSNDRPKTLSTLPS